MKVYVVWDPISEWVVSVHKTEAEAQKRVEEKNEEYSAIRGELSSHEFDEFELED